MLDDHSDDPSRPARLESARKPEREADAPGRRPAAWLGNTESQWATVIAAALALDLAIAERGEASIAQPPPEDDDRASAAPDAAPEEALDQAILDALKALDTAISAGPVSGLGASEDDTPVETAARADANDHPESSRVQLASVETTELDAAGRPLTAPEPEGTRDETPGALHVVNRGAIVAFDNAIEAISQTGDVVVDSVGALISLARSAIVARAAGSVTVESQGDLTAAESGVMAHSEVVGDVSVTHKGSIFAGPLFAAPSEAEPAMFAEPSAPAIETPADPPQRLFAEAAEPESAEIERAEALAAAPDDIPEWASGPLPSEPEFLDDGFAIAPEIALDLPVEPAFLEQSFAPAEPGPSEFLLEVAKAVQEVIWDAVDQFDFQPDPEDPPVFPAEQQAAEPPAALSVGVDASAQDGAASVAVEGDIAATDHGVKVQAEANASISMTGDAASVTGAALYAESRGRDVELEIEGRISSKKAVGVFASAKSGDVELEIEGRVSGGVGGEGEAVDGVRIASARGHIEIEIEGTVSGGTAQAGGSAAAIFLDSAIRANTDVEIENEGRLIAGTVDGVRDAALRLGGGDDRVENSGKITGDVLMGAGDDVFRNTQGGQVDGVIDGGAGDDIFFSGSLADVFRLSFGAGSDTVYNWQETDLFDFRDLADLNDAGADAIWEVDLMEDGQEYGRLTFFDGVEESTLTVIGDGVWTADADDVFLWV